MKALTVILLLLAAGCNNKKMAGGKCAATTDCAAGLLCAHSQCSAPSCVTNADCAAPSICAADFTCRSPPGTSSAFSVTSVHGDVVNPAGGYFVRSGLVVVGTGFDATTTAKLLASSLGKTWDLVVTPANATTFSVALPAEATTAITTAKAAVAMQVRVSSVSAGSVTRDVSLLQGETGPSGPPGLYQGDGNVVISSATSPPTVGLASPLDLGASAVKLPITLRSGNWQATNINVNYCSVVADGVLHGSGSQVTCDTTAPKYWPAAYVPCASDEVAIGGGCVGTPNTNNTVVINCPSRGGAIGTDYAGCLNPGTGATPLIGSGANGWGCRVEVQGVSGATPAAAYAICLKVQ